MIRRYRGNMLLVELVITLLFFSLSMVVIMQVFTTAQLKAQDSQKLNAAMMRAQDVAERLSREENPDALLMRLGFMGADGDYLYSDAQGYDLQVKLDVSDEAAGRLYSATVAASDGDKDLFAFPVAYYRAKEADAP